MIQARNLSMVLKVIRSEAKFDIVLDSKTFLTIRSPVWIVMFRTESPGNVHGPASEEWGELKYPSAIQFKDF